MQSKVGYLRTEQYVAPFKVGALRPTAASARAVTALPEWWDRSPHLARGDLQVGRAVGQRVLPGLPGATDRDPQKGQVRQSWRGLRGKWGKSKAVAEEEGVCGESVGEGWEEFREAVMC